MMERCSPDHPQVLLLFALEGEPTEEQAAAVRLWATRLVASRSWTVPAPQFVDEFDDDDIHTLGVFTHLYSSFPPWGEVIPLDLDGAQLEDVRHLIAAVAALSTAVEESIVVEYDGEAIGWIEAGLADDSIQDGLLGEWSRSIAAEARRRAPQ